jgi:peptidoglycan/LPS O-acetylase OafA/YrhL
VSNSLALPTPGQQFLFPLDTPDWSLFLEFIVNIFYALLLVRLPLRWIGAICFICACDLVYGAITIGNISLGPDWATLPFGLARVGFSFSVGIIFAGCWKEERRRATFLAAVLIGVFAFFLMVGMPARVRIIYNPLVAILVFPSILWLGSIWEVPRMFRRSCAFLGDISYPLYAIHFPLLVIFARFQQRHLNSPLGPGAWGAFLVSMLIISALLVSFYDAPLRAYVSAALKLRRSAPPQSV